MGSAAAMVDERESTESPRSPEAKVGMQVEDLWDTQEPQLSPTEKLNACFESIPVSAFPPAPQDQGISICVYVYMYICESSFLFVVLCLLGSSYMCVCVCLL